MNERLEDVLFNKETNLNHNKKCNPSTFSWSHVLTSLKFQGNAMCTQKTTEALFSCFQAQDVLTCTGSVHAFHVKDKQKNKQQLALFA